MLAGNDQIRESLDEFENWSDPGRLLVYMPTDRVKMEKMVFSATFSRLFLFDPFHTCR